MDKLFRQKPTQAQQPMQKQIFIVVGDIMLDKVTTGVIKGIANEAPVTVFKETESHYILGGAGNVCANIVALGGIVYPIGLIGADTNAKELTRLCKEKGMQTDGLIVDWSRPTICKHRYYVKNILLFRTDNELTTPATMQLEEQILHTIQMLVCQNCVIKIVLSDYNKGTLTDSLRTAIIEYANANNIMTFVDPKASLEKYRGCTFLKPNKAEALRLGGVDVDIIGLEAAHKQLWTQTGCKWSLITMAEDGMSLGAEDGRRYSQAADRLEVIDVTGAGDVVLAVMAYVWGQVCPQTALILATYLAKAAVMHCGTYVVRLADIDAAIAAATAPATPVSDRTVFTNGCFDLLHVGHLRLLEAARACGDRLIVGLNSDESVRRLKGPTRPVRSQAARAEMLLTLPWVDEVRIFEEDTPAALIADLRPDVLVKGGDYQLADIVGRENAGEVRIFPFQDGSENSSSKIIANVIQKNA